MSLLAGASGDATLRGRVCDERWIPVAGAAVTLLPAGRSTATDALGRLSFAALREDRFTSVVEAKGFARSETTRSASADTGAIQIRLARGAFTERVSVTATRTERRISETPESAVLLDSDEIAASAAPVIDRVLRQVPGFALFRRFDSRTANPTTQGVSLRRVGGSGASRAAVLDDGIPLNDPFGGWVYWSRVPALALDRAEAVRGGMSGLYGGPGPVGSDPAPPPRVGSGCGPFRRLVGER